MKDRYVLLLLCLSTFSWCLNGVCLCVWRYLLLLLLLLLTTKKGVWGRVLKTRPEDLKTRPKARSALGRGLLGRVFFRGLKRATIGPWSLRPHFLSRGPRPGLSLCTLLTLLLYTVYILFIYCSYDSQPFYSEKNIKNRSYGTIHIFKNYFTTVFSIFSNISGIQTDP